MQKRADIDPEHTPDVEHRLSEPAAPAVKLAKAASKAAAVDLLDNDITRRLADCAAGNCSQEK